MFLIFNDSVSAVEIFILVIFLFLVAARVKMIVFCGVALYILVLKMEALNTSETLVSFSEAIKKFNIPEGSIKLKAAERRALKEFYFMYVEVEDTKHNFKLKW
jgi:hypothetical protein